MSDLASVQLASIQEAYGNVRSVAKHTPAVPSVILSNLLGVDVWLKAENLQTTGSFKIRGAMNKLATLKAAAKAGVTAGSAGNHAQALAYAARHFEVPCEIFVPTGAPIAKIQGCQSFGAHTTEGGASLNEAVEAARAHAAETGMVFCHPFDDTAVVTGQGTLGIELIEDFDQLSCVVVPLGGGGLAGGLAIAVKSLRPEVWVVGVQAEVCAPYAGLATPHGAITTLADGIAVKSPGGITAPLVAEWLDEIVTVTENSIADAMVMLMDKAKLYVEGAGAVGVAALMNRAVIPPAEGTTCVVLSGGNVDLGVVPGLIRRHENAAQRRLTVFVRIDDRPGGLARFLQIFADGGANLLEVEHLREGISLHVRETGVRATFEVRSPTHATDLIQAAQAANYKVTIDTRN